MNENKIEVFPRVANSVVRGEHEQSISVEHLGVRVSADIARRTREPHQFAHGIYR